MKKQLLSAVTATGILFSAFSGTVSAHEKQYTVKSGDTLSGIAKETKISVSDLTSYNNLSSSLIKVGQKLSLLPPHIHYSVKSGDSLSKIAKNNNTTVTKIKELNSLTSDLIKIGQDLLIPSSNSTPNTNTSESKTNTTTTYTVVSGDSLYAISLKVNLTVDELKKINGLTSNTIYVGQVLKVSSTNTNTNTTTSENNTSKVDALIKEAKKYIGVPYVWGGSTPNGFDCSGYLNYVYNKIGTSIPRTVATIWNATTIVSSPKAGDIVFFETTSGPSHAGIYIGDNKFIHAGTSTGVTITDMNNSYWKPRYLGAKAVF